MDSESFIEDSFCGLRCGACEILVAYRKGRENGSAPKWSDLPRPLRDYIPPADIVCQGCKTDKVFAGCRGCRVRECARERNVEACVVCPDFPCHRVEQLRALIPGIKDRLPHTVTIFGDTETARDRGYEAWAEAQRARWTCPACGAPFTWYQERCRGCGLGLKDARGY